MNISCGLAETHSCPATNDLGTGKMTVTEIESAISRLTPDDLAELMQWFQHHYAEVWDRQIEADLDAGRLDALLSKVEQEYSAGLARPL